MTHWLQTHCVSFQFCNGLSMSNDIVKLEFWVSMWNACERGLFLNTQHWMAYMAWSTRNFVTQSLNYLQFFLCCRYCRRYCFILCFNKSLTNFVQPYMHKGALTHTHTHTLNRVFVEIIFRPFNEFTDEWNWLKWWWLKTDTNAIMSTTTIIE